MPRSNQQQPIPRCCKVDGCISALEGSYASKHRVCWDHRRADKVMFEGKEAKWCQGCTRFIDLHEHSKGTGRCLACLKKIKRKRIAKKRQSDEDDSGSDDDDSGTETDDEEQPRKTRKTATGTCTGRGRRTAVTTNNNNNQEDIIVNDTRKARSPSPCLPSSPLSSHTHSDAPQLPSMHVTSGPSPALPLTPPQIPPFQSLSSRHHFTQASLSCDAAVPTVPNQAQLVPTANLIYSIPPHAPYSADAQPPFATPNAPGLCDNRPVYVPSPYGLTLPATPHYPSLCQPDDTADELSAMLQQEYPDLPGCSPAVHTGDTVCGPFNHAGSSARRGNHTTQPWRGHTSHHTATDGAWLPSQHVYSSDMGLDDVSLAQFFGLDDSIFDGILSEPSSVSLACQAVTYAH